MIVSCGEALIDFLPRTGPNGERYFEPLAGGSPFNVAVAVGRLGASAGFFGGLSSDFFGAMLRQALEASQVDLSLVHPTERPSTLAFVSLDNGNARYAFFDEASAGRMVTEADLPALPKEVAALHFGSFSLAEEPCGSAFEALMHREQHARVISLDPNIRPTLIKNRDGHIARLERLVAMADIVKLSEEDLAWLAPDAEPVSFVRGWLDKGAKLVILTRGADGIVAMTESAEVTIPAVPVTVADTVGAGDTFTAATLAYLDRNGILSKHAVAGLDEDRLRNLTEFAARAASITVSRAGANPPWAEELGL